MIYYTKVKLNEMKCNLCETTLNVNEKSPDLIDHMKNDHKDVYSLHKDNPDATVGFRIEFLQLNMLREDGDPKDSSGVIVEEICENTSDSDAQKQLLEAAAKAEEDAGNYVYYSEHPEKKTPRPITRKRSWVWKFFIKMSDIIYRCKLCNVVLSIKGCNTNNMNRHVKSRHPIVYRSEMSKKPDKNEELVVTLPPEEVDTPYAIKTEEIYASDRSIETEEADTPTQKHRRSWIWTYFDRVSATQAQCKLCKRYICHGGSATGNMNRHLKMIHHKTAHDSSWVWKVFESSDHDWYSCKICQFRCHKYEDLEKCMTCILLHLKQEHGVISGDQIITGSEINEN